MGKSTSRTTDPLQPADIFNNAKKVEDPFFGKVETKEISQRKVFSPDDYSYVQGANPYGNLDTLNKVNAQNQPIGEQWWNATKQFGANLVSSIGQALANTFDFSSTVKSAKAALNGEPDNFQSYLFGLSTKDMQDWAEGVAKRNQILEENPGEFDLGSSAWWAKQFASTGTGIGMAAEAIGTTAAIEFATGGLGTAAAVAKLGSMIKRIRSGARGVEALSEAMQLAKGMRSAATMYGTLSRYSESRMEAMQSYNEIYEELGKEVNDNGQPKFNEEVRKKLASEGARRTYALNMALLPIDILGYRAMIYNPISGSSTGLLERGLSKIGSNLVRKGVQAATSTSLEGIEEGFQYIGSQEGKHYAKVLGGMDDGSSFLERLGNYSEQDEMWNSVAGGIVGSPIIAGAANRVTKVMNGNRANKLQEIHKNYVQNIARMDSAISDQIKNLESRGESREAAVLRRQFGASKALSALHLDALTDNDTAFDSRLNFLQGTLEELSTGKIDILTDLGFSNPSVEQVETVKKEFQQYVEDANLMKSIYDNVKNKYNKNFVPEITQDHFQLQTLLNEKNNVEQDIAKHGAELSQYYLLSLNGKEIYNTEYQLQSLKTEESRLIQAYRNAEDSFEKRNFGELLDINKKKIADITKRFNDLQNDEAYTDDLKRQDNDIIQSALYSSEYLEAISNRERLDNSIILKRKEIANWNNPDYQSQRLQQAVTKAKTKAQVKATAEAIEGTPQADTIAEALKEKEAQIETQEAIDQIRQDETSSIPGDFDLFGDEEATSIIQDLRTTSKPSSNIIPLDDENQNVREPEYLFAPAAYDFDSSPQESKDRIVNGVKGLVDRIGDNTSFEDLVRHIVKSQGETVAEEIFNAVKYGWEANGFKPTDYQAVYNAVFGNPMDELMGGIRGLSIQTTNQLTEATDNVTNKIEAKEAGQVNFDNNNQPVYIYTGFVTNESSPKLAFFTRLSQLIQTVNEDNSITVSHEYTSEELGTGDYINSLPLLDPDQFNEKTELVAKIPSNFSEIKIPVYNPDGTKGQSMSFGQYVATKGLTPDMQEYQDKVPIIIYRKNAIAGEKGLAFVHDVGWYHPLRFNQEFKDDMTNAISNTRNIRKSVIDNNNSADITITSKRQTTFSGLKTRNGETISLREANPLTQLTVAKNTDELNTSKTSVAYPNDNSLLINNSPFSIGSVYEVRRFGKKEGKDTYVALPVLKPKLDEGSKTSVLQAITIYANRSNTSPAVRTLHDAVTKSILDTMSLDILSPQGLEKYLQHFINTFNVEKAKTNVDVEVQAKAKLSPGTPYIAFIAGGNIVFGRAGEPAYVGKDNKIVGSFFINPNSSTPSTVSLNNLAKPNIIGWYEQNVNLDNLSRNKPVLTINKDMKTTVAANNYNDYLLDRLQTNVRSHNIGTEENPNYITNIQPVITYDLTSKLKQQVSNTSEQVTEEEAPFVREENSITPTEDLPSNLSEIERKILEDAKRDLGKDFGISKMSNQFLFSPAPLTEEQRKQVTSSINRIAGLTPDQQFDITDFMYNQITSIVNLDTKTVSRKEVDSHVEKSFNSIIQPLKEQYQDKVKEMESLLEKHPTLKNSSIPDVIKDYQYRISKIDAITNSFDVLKEEAYLRVAKYTGITESKTTTDLRDKVKTSNEENQDNSVEESANEKETDFWTDILTENPENKLSYTMRRFFGQIKNYDKNGNVITGFLGLPTYVGADQVTRTLMVTLADVPSSFDAMIAKLESRKESIPWMSEVIDRLKASDQQKRNQFVTVMSNTSLRMKFLMISFNRKTNTWTTKVYDTNLNGVANAVKEEWRTNFKDTDLLLKDVDSEGNNILNKTRAQSLINTFESWKGNNLKVIEGDISVLRPIADQVKNERAITFTPTGAMLQWLKTNLVRNSDRVKFSMKGFDYQVANMGDGKFQMSFLNKSIASKEEIKNWLREFGINLHPSTLDELMEKGLFHNYKLNKPNDLFDDSTNTNGLFGILYNKLKILVAKETHDFTEYGDSPLDESVISSLANLESKYNETQTPFGFRDNGKSFFALTAPKFITDRARDLKKEDDSIRKQLGSLSFSQGSLWLQLLNDTKFRDRFTVSHIGANAFKELGKKLYRDNGITKLSDIDHELTKLGMFWDSTQGEVRYSDKGLSTYPNTNVEMRMATMFSPTMSDKQMVTLITTSVLNLQNKDLNNGEGISDEVAKIIYEQTVKPELKRMLKHSINGGKTNIAGYDKGAAMFLLMPEMNNIEWHPNLKLVDAIKHGGANFTLNTIENNEEVMNKFTKTIKDYITRLTQEKLDIWKNNGFIVSSNKEAESELRFFDRRYLDKFRGDNTSKASMAAMDYIVNSIIANANSFMVMAGDPALYFKSKATDYLTMAKDTFINVGKRLANQIAPGTTLSESENEKYLQLFIEDRKSLPEIPFLKFVTKINDGNEITDAEIETLKSGTKSQKQSIVDKYPVSSGYFSIEGSDAQEYTTWKEHLDILVKLGKTSDTLLDITPEDIQEARELFASNKDKSKLTERDLQLIGKVMQPIKPVYTGQLFDAEQDVMRTMYIKSSSFPLIPQLTAGMEIDKLRQRMEAIQSKTKLNVRASYQTANKVGSLTNPAIIWSNEGRMDDEKLAELEKSALVLDRKNFRIQQEVPFKSGKGKEDKITLGTQLMKLLFGDEMLAQDGFIYDGKEYTGKELHSIYNTLFNKLIQEKRNQLFNELGLDSQGAPMDVNKSMQKLQQILKEEATKRGYPLQDIEGLTMNEQGEFILPLWASSNSNRYESMLNAIVTNRLIRMKFPGNSYVVGSEEGFIVQENLKGIDQSRIVWTSGWNGKSLQAAYHSNGQLKSAQVLVGSKFRDNEGNLIDLLTKENGEYKYVTKTDTGFLLKEGMFDKELLSLTSFRIPTSGHQSGSHIEIVGFLPYQNADLMIVPRNFTKQKGLDFDVDKENTYQLWHYMTEGGRFEVLKQEHKNKLLSDADKELKSELSNGSEGKLLANIFGDEIKYTEEDIKGNKVLSKLDSKITEKLVQNEIVKIHASVFTNSKAAVQAKINKTLNTDFAEAQAEFIEQLSISGKDEKYWTPLSDEYQKQKMMLGASGKIGTGAYSLDVVFHSLVQQSALTGKPLQLTELAEEGEIRNKVWRFGKIKSEGKLGGTLTLDGGRTISELQAERQNLAVDNEKLQIMGRVNLNDLTMDVDKVFNMLGFDKGEDGNSISFLFLSQPIIKQYVERMKNASSNVATFESNKEQKIVDDLLSKYEEKASPVINEDYWNQMEDMMTNDNFIENIKGNVNGQLQGAVLRRFIEMKNYGVAIRNIQTTINTDSKGLGKSFFDVIEKRNALNRLGANSSMIQGAPDLIGTYVLKDEIPPVQQSELTAQGFVDIGAYLVKPSTLSGAFNIYGVSTAYNLWSNHFPYDTGITLEAFKEVLPIISSGEVGSTKSIDLKQEVFKGMRKYFSAFRVNGIIQREDEINSERRRLYVDSEDNTSLAKYLKEIKQMNDNPVIDTFIKTNKLLNRFEFDIKKNGEPSLIKFNNAAGEEFDEQYLYESLTTLMERTLELPQVGNKKYTLSSLAQDLIAYAYLGNATQEAIQFTKYIPVSYLNTVGYSRVMRVASQQLKDNRDILGLNIKSEGQEHLVGEFTMQFIQHNPERVKYKLDSKNFSKETIKIDDNSFRLKSDDRPTFISVYDPSIPKGEKKFKLYWFDGSKYVKIPVLGTFGMDEYQPRNGIGTSLVNGRSKIVAEPQTVISSNIVNGQEIPFGIGVNTGYEVVESIYKSNTTSYTQLAKVLLPYIGDTKINIGNIPQWGMYNPINKTITISDKILNNTEAVADTLLHEIVHKLTYHEIDKYTITNDEGEVSLKDNAPSHVSAMVRLYNSLRNLQNGEKLKEILEKVRTVGVINTEDKNQLYGYTNIHDFMTMALTNREFQKALNQIPYKQTGNSFLEKFKDIIRQVLVSLGVQFDEKYTAAHAISNIFDIIEKANKVESTSLLDNFDPYTINYSSDDIDNSYNDGDLVTQLSPGMFPEKDLIILNEKC